MAKSALREAERLGFGDRKVTASKTSKPGADDPENAVLEALGNRKLARAIESKDAGEPPEAPPPAQPQPVVSKNEGGEAPASTENREGDQPEDQTILALTQEQVMAIATAASEQTRAEETAKQQEIAQQHQTALDAKDQEIEAARAEAEAANARAEEAQKQRDALSSVFKLTGTPEPVAGAPGETGVTTKKSLEVLGEGSQEMRSWEHHVDLAKKNGKWVTGKKAGRSLCFDTRASDAYFRQHRDRIRDGVEAILKTHGMFGAEPSKEAITTAANIPSINFTYLSAVIRNSHFEDLTHYQFAHDGIELGRKPGLEIAVPRVPYRARPVAPSDRILTTGTPLTTESDPVNELLAYIRLLELGLGKDAANAPLGFSDFIEAYSMMSLENQVENILGYDYAYTKDLFLRSQWFRSPEIVYNKAGSIANAPGDLNTGDGGTMSEDFLTMLRAYMKTRLIPTYRDGCYGINMNPIDLGNFMKDKGTKERDQALQNRDLVIRMLQASVNRDFGGEVSGYRGTFNGFHIFEQNVYGVGPEADDPGVNNLTAGDGNDYDFLTSMAFGRDTIAWCTGMPAEIRMSSDKDFDRQSILTWISHENAGSLDVLEDAATGEQLRVVQTRCLARAL